MPSRYKVKGRVNASEGATVTIDRARCLVSVRPKHERREYVVPLLTVAQVVVSIVVKSELGGDKTK